MEKCSFSVTNDKEMEEEIKCLNKPTTHNNIPDKLLVLTKDICAPLLTKIYNNSKYDGSFPTPPKCADITPAHKKDETTKKENHRPGQCSSIHL